MYKRTRVLAAVLALTVLAAACGDDDDAVSRTGSTDAPQSTTTEATTTTTRPAATTTTAAGGSSGASGSIAAGTPEADAADAYAIVFDSTTSFDEKAPHLEDADALADTIAAYAAAGERMGGIKLTPTAVTITGDTAAVTYDVYFGTTKQYGDLPGSIDNDGDDWVVSRAEFCGFMASARTPCAS